MKELNEKLILIQKELKAPKKEWNDFGKFHYRSYEKILESAKPICHKHDVMLYLSDEIKCIGNRNYVEATATITHLGQSLSVKASACEAEIQKGMNSAQITGSASSFARKYALNGLFLLDDTTEADSTNNSTGETDEVINNEQITEINALVVKTKSDPVKVLAYASKFGKEVMTYNELTQIQYKAAKSQLELKVKYANNQ